MAEIEFRVLASECLNRRIPTIEDLNREIQAWYSQRNELSASIDWRFTTHDARIKLKRFEL